MRKRIILAVQAALAVAVIVLGIAFIPAQAAASPLNLADSAHATSSNVSSFVSANTIVKPSYHPRLITVVSYTVRNGDTLGKIAASHNLTWQGLYCYNEKTIGSNPGLLLVGEKLTLKTAKCIIKQPVIRTAQNTTSTSNSAPVSTPTSVQPSGSLQAYALTLLNGSQTEFSCLNSIIDTESSWNIYAYNPSGAYGIPQALPGSKMAVAGADWQTNGFTQLRWMVNDYVNPVYGSACNAWSFHLAHGWY